MTSRLPEDLDRRVKARAQRENLPISRVTKRLLKAGVVEDLGALSEQQKSFLVAAAVHAVRDLDVMERLA